MSETPKITKLPRNGPQNGQSVSQWLYGKSQGDKQWQQKVDAAKSKKRLEK